MLDYEHYREAHEIDVEVRLTDIRMQTSAARRRRCRGPRGRRAWECGADGAPPPGFGRWTARPVRPGVRLHALFRPDGDMLGFNNLNSIGAGLELDTSVLDRIATRWRLIGSIASGTM